MFDDVEQGIVLAEDIWVSAVSLLLRGGRSSGISSVAICGVCPRMDDDADMDEDMDLSR